MKTLKSILAFYTQLLFKLLLILPLWIDYDFSLGKPKEHLFGELSNNPPWIYFKLIYSQNNKFHFEIQIWKFTCFWITIDNRIYTQGNKCNIYYGYFGLYFWKPNESSCEVIILTESSFSIRSTDGEFNLVNMYW